MSKQFKGVKVRIYPNKQQADMIDEYGASARHMWNELLSMQKARYDSFKELYSDADEETKSQKRKGIYISKYAMIYLLKPFKNEEGHEWAKRMPSQALQNVCADLDNAFKKFFKKQGGYPRFKSWHLHNDSFSFQQGCEALDSHHIKFPKLGVMKFRGFDSLCEYKIKAATLRKGHDNFYYASCRVEHDPAHLKKVQRVVGIDLGVSDLAILSDGKKFPKLENIFKDYQRSQERLKVWQKKYSRRREHAKKIIAMTDQMEKKLGHSYEGKHNLEDFSNLQKAKVMVARYHTRIANQRKYYLQQLTTELIRNYDTIVIEDLKPSNMVKNHHLARAIEEASFFEFRRELEYKCDWYDKTLVVVAPNYTTQVCSTCGFNSGKKELSIRKWDCPKCGTHHDRDINAAKNVLNKGLDKLKKKNEIDATQSNI